MSLGMAVMNKTWSLADDLEDVFQRSASVWAELRGARIFLTGGTGFIGCWLLETLRHADLALDLDIKVSILTRDAGRFSQKAPHLVDHPSFEFIKGDIIDFAFPKEGYTHVIHAATDASAYLNEFEPDRMFDVIVAGTRRALDLAAEKKPKRFLLLSSGAVYGQQPPEMHHAVETFLGSLDCTNPRNAYAEGKRAAEMLSAIYGRKHDLDIVTARIFTLLGPYMPLDTHFAAGNFILDAMNGQGIVVKGNGRPRRSYLYAGDLAVWLWHILVHGAKGRAYNVGSDEDISIAELATCVSRTIGTGETTVLGANDTGWNAGRYVPDTTLVRTELDLHATVPLEEAIRRTALWNGWHHA